MIEDRTVIKATWIRGTLHLVTAEDYLLLRTTLHAVLTGASETIAKRRGADVETDTVIAAAMRYLAEQPHTFTEISTMLSELMPDRDVGAMRYTVRMHLPLVQVPISSGWSYPGNLQFTLAESWLGKTISTEDNLRTLVFRYLTAFGPASVTDIQTWSGLGKLKAAIEKLKPELITYRDEQGRELFDLPDLSLSAADTPVPERFLPEFDNLLLSHSKRTRVIADVHRSKVYLPGLRVAATFLIDGFVGGVWKIEKAKSIATIMIEPFEPLTQANRKALTDEAEQLVRFVEADAKTFEVRFVDS